MSEELITRSEAAAMVAASINDLLANQIPDLIAQAMTRTRIANVSTADSGREALVDGIQGYTSGINGVGTTEAGRVELAGHLTIPRTEEPALSLGQLGNAAYIPLASVKYRPTGGKPGDAAQYGLTDQAGQHTVIWTREDGSIQIRAGSTVGKIEIDSGGPDKIVLNGGTQAAARVGDAVKVPLVLQHTSGGMPPISTISIGQFVGTPPVFVLWLSFQLPTASIIFPAPAPFPAATDFPGEITSGAPRVDM